MGRDDRTHRVHRNLAAVVVALVVMAACGGNGSIDELTDAGNSAGGAMTIGPGDPLPVPPAEATVDPRDHGITLTDDTVVVTGGPGVVLETSADGRTYVLAGDADGVGEIEAEDVLLVTGMLSGRVEDVTEAGDDVEVTLSPVALTDLIQDGTLEWENTELDPSRAIVRTWEEPVDETTYLLEETPEDPTAQVGETERSMGGPSAPRAAGRATAPTQSMDASTSVTYGDYRIRVGSTNADDGTTTRRVEVTATRGGLDLSLIGIITHQSLSASGSLGVSGGKVTAGQYQVNGMSGTIDLRATVRYGQGASSVDDLINIPWAEVWPVYVYGIPFYVSLRFGVVLTPALTTEQAEIGMAAKITFDGNGGWELSGGALSPAGEIKVESSESPLPNVHVNTYGAVGFVAALQAPRVGLGLGFPPITAGTFVDVVTSLGITHTGAVAMPQCTRSDLFATARGGIEMSFGFYGFGVTSEEAAKVELGRITSTETDPPTRACPLA